MAKYIIALHTKERTAYVYGGAYNFLRKQYAILTDSQKEAKRYSSKRRAKNAYDNMYRDCVNVRGRMEIIEVDEHG